MSQSQDLFLVFLTSDFVLACPLPILLVNEFYVRIWVDCIFEHVVESFVQLFFFHNDTTLLSINKNFGALNIYISMAIYFITNFGTLNIIKYNKTH